MINWLDVPRVGTIRNRRVFAFLPYHTYINRYWLRTVDIKERWNGSFWETFEVEDETLEGFG